MEQKTDTGRGRADEIPVLHQPFRDRFEWYLRRYMERNPKGKHSDIYNEH